MELKDIARKLKNEKSVAIFCHVLPDGDCIGSAVALKLALIKAGIYAEVFCDDVIPEKFSFLPETSSFKRELAGNFSAFFAVDCADLTRIGKFSNNFSSFKNTYNIDHHISNTRYADNNYVKNNSSNCENIYELICLMGIEIDGDIANLLMTGVMTDTGNFRHSSVTANTFAVAGRLLTLGANVNQIHYYMFTRQSKQRAALFGKVMTKIRYFADGKMALISIFTSDFKETGAKIEETEGFIDFLTGIEGVEVAVSMRETENGAFKISLRSKKTNVNEIAAIFGGGGHERASGCKIFGEYEEVVDKIRYAVISHMAE